MKIHTNNFNFPADQKLILTLGMFDGVHLGHQFVLKYVREIAEKEGGETSVMTFNPYPRLVLKPETDFKLITTLEEKSRLLEKFSVRHLFIQEFTREFSKLSALEFVRDFLVAKLNIHSLVVGYDHQFGKNRDGNYEQLKIFSEQFGFKLYRLPAISEQGTIISSTKIRNKISKGEMVEANEYLGYNFMMRGKVVEGDRLGRQLGFPTANLEIDKHKICPQKGVYFVKVKVQGKCYYGMMNIGMRPTIDGLKKQIEVHILDFYKDIYGEEIEVDFYDRARDEVKFSSLEQLKNRLSIDKSKTKAYFNNLLK